MSYYYQPSSTNGTIFYGQDSMSASLGSGVGPGSAASYHSGIGAGAGAGVPGSGLGANGLTNHSSAYRSASTSPPFGANSINSINSVTSMNSSMYPMFSTARYNASRGFDPEDDMEFCPALMPSSAAATIVSCASSTSDASELIESPLSSPMPVTAVLDSPKSGPRPRKVIQIVDPSTGLKVGSPPAASMVIRH